MELLGRIDYLMQDLRYLFFDVVKLLSNNQLGRCKLIVGQLLFHYAMKKSRNTVDISA